MFEVTVEETFAAAHQLREYQGKCENLHGHNYRTAVEVEGPLDAREEAPHLRRVRRDVARGAEELQAPVRELEDVGDHAPHVGLVIDDEDRENEGDLTMAAEKVTPEAINFMAKNARGLICVALTEERAVKATTNIARAPDRVAHTLLDLIVDNYKPALDELALEIAELEQRALQHPTAETLNKILQVKKEVLHLRQIIGPQREVLARYRGSYLGILGSLLRPLLMLWILPVTRILKRAETCESSQ